MLIDLHCHSKYSYDNYLDPERLIEKAVSRKLDGVCFTEHFSVEASEPVEKIKTPDGFHVFRGVEVSTSMGHLLVYGLENDSWNIWGANLHLNASKVIDMVHDLGGICVPAHPFRGFESFGERLLCLEGVDAVETHNGRSAREQNDMAVRAAQKLHLPSVGGSDCHRIRQVGRAFTVFKNPVSTMEQLVREIKEGNCFGAEHIELETNEVQGEQGLAGDER